jgi:large subunit ribosomal protein L23
VPQDQAQIVAGAAQQGMDGIAHGTREMVAREFAVELHVTNHGLDRRAAAQLAPHGRGQAAPLTEKVTALRESSNTVGFLVHPDANRLQIKQAVETLLKVKVARVNVLNVQGKIKRLGRFSGKRSDWKKAFVKLKEGEKLELYESA